MKKSKGLIKFNSKCKDAPINKKKTAINKIRNIERMLKNCSKSVKDILNERLNMWKSL